MIPGKEGAEGRCYACLLCSFTYFVIFSEKCLEASLAEDIICI